MNPYEIMCEIKNNSSVKHGASPKKRVINLNHRRPVRVVKQAPASPPTPPPASTIVKAESKSPQTLADQFAPKWTIGELCFTGEGEL